MKNVEGSFKKEYPFDKRISESERILAKFPDRIPVIVQISKNCIKELPVLDKHKYLVPQDLTVGQFQYVIRKRIKLTPEKALYMFFQNSIPPTGSLISSVYDKYKDPDGFLYTIVSLISGLGNVGNDIAA